MDKWEVVDTGRRSAEENMRIDADLLASLDEHSHPILHFYDWEVESATYGYFVKPQEFLDLEKSQKRGLSLARRPTGGGIVFHIWDLAFSVLVPSQSRFFSQNVLENYQFVNQAVLHAAEELIGGKELELIGKDAPEFDPACGRFCMAKPTKYDLVLKGRKIAGAAQRQRKNGFLHQGTIALVTPSEEYLKDVLLPGTRVLEAMQAHTMPLFDGKLHEGRRIMRELLQKHLIRGNQ